MKICILGSGALGSSIGGILIEGGLEIYLIDSGTADWFENVWRLV